MHACVCTYFSPPILVHARARTHTHTHTHTTHTGQYAERIDNSQELLEAFIEEFRDLDVEVQLQLLTATVKLFLKKPTTAQTTVKNVLDLATAKSTNPDLRDRGYIYWRLLSSDPEKARVVVLGDQNVSSVQYDAQHLDANLLDTLLYQVSSLASVYHKPAESFLVDSAREVLSVPVTAATEGKADADAGSRPNGEAGGSDLDVLDLVSGRAGDKAGGAGAGQKPAVVDDLLDLLGEIGGGAAAAPAAAPAGGGASMLGLMGGLDLGIGRVSGGQVGMEGSAGGSKPFRNLLTAERGGGMAVEGAINRRAGQVFYDLTFRNAGTGLLSGIAIQVNKNVMGLTNAAALAVGTIPPGGVATVALTMAHNPEKVAPPVAGASPLMLQVAVKNNAGIFYFKDLMPFDVLLKETVTIASNEYPQRWQARFL